MATFPEILPPELPLADAEAHLETIARAITGFDDLGEDDYREGLRILLHSFDEDANLTDAGRQRAAGLTVMALAGRLVSQAGWKAHPEYHDVTLTEPIIIVGLPRTATTTLHRLLCRDPGHQGPELWLAQHPLPRPPVNTWSDHPAFQRCRELLLRQQESSPALSAIHEMIAEEPDECWNLLRQNFTSITFECSARVHAYAQWWAECDMSRAYQRWADNLRLIGLNDRSRRWILKDPSHLFAPETLLSTVSDATIIMTHRDPARSIPSVCSLTVAGREESDRDFDNAAHGRAQLELWGRGLDRMMAARARHPDRFLDVEFQEFLADPLGVVARIYEQQGKELPREAREAMTSFLSSQTTGPARHQYAADQFGLTADEIRARFADYIETFGVTLET